MPKCTVVCQCFSICWGPAMALPSLQKWALQQDICGQRLLTYSKRMVVTAWNGPRNLHGMFMQLLPCTIFSYIMYIYIRALQHPAGVSRGTAQPTCPLHAQWAISGILWTVNRESLPLEAEYSASWSWSVSSEGLVLYSTSCSMFLHLFATSRITDMYLLW